MLGVPFFAPVETEGLPCCVSTGGVCAVLILSFVFGGVFIVLFAEEVAAAFCKEGFPFGKEAGFIFTDEEFISTDETGFAFTDEAFVFTDETGLAFTEEEPLFLEAGFPCSNLFCNMLHCCLYSSNSFCEESYLICVSICSC